MWWIAKYEATWIVNMRWINLMFNSMFFLSHDRFSKIRMCCIRNKSAYGSYCKKSATICAESRGHYYNNR
jgi:hypothetical protein